MRIATSAPGSPEPDPALLRIARERLGPPDRPILRAVKALIEREGTDAIIERVLRVKNWQEFLDPERSR